MTVTQDADRTGFRQNTVFFLNMSVRVHHVSVHDHANLQT